MKTLIWHWLTLFGEILRNNGGWMSWNLFLALLPLAISFWLFRRSRWQWFHAGIGLLLGITLVPNLQRAWGYGSHIVRELGFAYVLSILLITVGLMAWDFRPRRRHLSHSLNWWVGFFTWIAFLPNAPYVLTDVIHFINDIREYDSVWVITLMIIPLYLLFMVVGFQAYVLSVINLGHYLQRYQEGRFVPLAEWVIHSLSAVGIYLGRFQRFNSWDILTDPEQVVNTTINNLMGKGPVLVMFITFVVISSLYWLFKQITVSIIHWQQFRQKGGFHLAQVSVSVSSTSSKHS